MSDNRVADAVCLVLWPVVLQYKVTRDYSTLELERHARRRQEAVGSTDIMQETRKIVRLRVVLPGREVGLDQCGA